MKTNLRHILAVAAMLVAPLAHADFYVIVPANNAQQTLTQKEAVNLFMGRSRAFSNGDFAQPYDMPRDSAVRADFYRQLTGMSAAQINSYWSRLMFSGQTLPPQPLSSEQAMVESLRANANGLGYLTTRPTDDDLRTVLVLTNEQP